MDAKYNNSNLILIYNIGIVVSGYALIEDTNNMIQFFFGVFLILFISNKKSK